MHVRPTLPGEVLVREKDRRRLALSAISRRIIGLRQTGHEDPEMSTQMNDAARTRLDPDEIERMLATAVGKGDLDMALAPLQQQIGVSTGDVAGAVFSRFKDERAKWAAAGAAERREILLNYLRAEHLYGDPGIRDRLANLGEIRDDEGPTP